MIEPPWITDLIKNLSGVVLGWILGLATSSFVEWRQKRKKVHAIKIAVSKELREVAHRLLVISYTGEFMQGRLNRELLEWMYPLVKRYEGPNPNDQFLAAVEGLLKSSDEELAKLAAYQKKTMQPQFWPGEEASYATASASQIHDFDPKYAVRLLDILSHLRMFNEARERWEYYFQLTFVPGLTSENYARTMQNVNATDEQITKRARIIVDKITDLEQKYPV
jgi:hypothetical protein